MNKGATGPFKEILTAAKERRGELEVDSMIVSSHLAQKRLFMLRRGDEFLQNKILTGWRKFIAKVCEENMLDMKQALLVLPM